MNRNLAIGYTFLVVAIWLWAGNSVVARSAMVADVPPLALNFFRWVGALLIFLPFTARGVWRQRRAFLDHWLYCVAFGLVSVTAFNSVFYVGLQYTTAVQGSLIQSILPVLVLILVATLPSEHVTGRQLWGVVLSIAGAAVILLRGDPEMALTLSLNKGDLWCLGAVAIWAVQVLLLRWKPARFDMPCFMTVIIAAGVVGMIPLWLLERSTGRVIEFTPTTLAFLAYVAVFASVIGAALFNAGVVRIGTATSGYFGNLYPVFSAILAVGFLGEAFMWFHALGGALVLGGIYLATVTRRAATAGESA